MRLDKLLANMGYGSRKEVRQLLKKGAVQVNAKPVKDPALHVDPGEGRSDNSWRTGCLQGIHLPHDE